MAGLPDLMERLNDLGEAVEGDDIYRVLREAAQIPVDRAKAAVAYGTTHDDERQGPHIRDLIFSGEGDPSRDTKGPSVVLGAAQRYLLPHNRAVLLERGTSKTRAQPFWRPALVSSRPEMAETIASGLKGIIAVASLTKK